MAELASVGGYVPLYRIERSVVAEQHGTTASGETAVPARDETRVTMACEAAGTALDRAPGEVGAVFAASVSDPYAEHGIAAHVASRHGLDGDTRTGDFRATPRAATDAFLSAKRFVAATGERALVTASDALPVEPGHDDEAYSGAGAGAALLAPERDGGDRRGDGDDAAPAATIHGVGERTTGFVERHREHGQPAESGDRRFEGEYGFGEAVPAAATAALETAPAMPAAAVVAAPDARVARGAIEEFPGEVDLVSTFDAVGYAGSASFLLDLAHLVESRAETTAVALCYGAGGADAVALTARDGDPPGSTVAEQIDAKRHVTYAEHLRYRQRPEYGGVGP
jgi:3-hydroxy-3-methylglutaryl CoA synthase